MEQPENKEIVPTSRDPQGLRFGDYELDLERRELRRRGIRLQLAPKPFDLLVRLVRRAGEVVTREDIRRLLWGEETHVEVEGGINAYVGQVRSVLEDRATAPRYIETVPRRGYRFVAEVEAIVADDPVQAPSVAKPIRRLAVGLGLGTAALLAWALFAFWPGMPEASPSAESTPRLLVLPFDEDEAAESAFLADGLTEELIRELVERYGERLSVIAPVSALRIRELDQPASNVAQRLGVDYLVRGRVLREGDAVRLNVRMTDARNGEVLWSTGYDRSFDDLLSLQAEVAEKIARSLSLQVPSELLQARAGSRRALRSDAWTAYLQGRVAQHRARAATDQERFGRHLTTAREALERSVEIDPGFARAWVALARVRQQQRPAQADLADVIDALETALALDDREPEAHLMRGTVSLFHEWNPTAAAHHLRRARSLAPGMAALHQAEAFLHLARNDPDAARDSMDRALVLDPLSPWCYSDLGWLLYFSGRPQEAVRECSRWPDLLGAQECRLQAAWVAGDLTAAAEVARRRLIRFGGGRIDPAWLRSQPEDAVTRRYWQGTARWMRAQESPGFSFIAVAEMASGREEEALRALEEAFESGSGWYLPFLHLDPLFEPLRGNSRFESLIDRVRRLDGSRVPATG